MINMFINRKRFSLVSVIIISFVSSPVVFGAKADTILNGIRIETKAHYGFIYPHHKAIHYLLDGNISGYEINFSTESSGRHQWEKLYRYPRYGTAYSFTNFANPEVLGYAHGFYVYIDIPFFKPKKNFSLNYQVDCGLGYITKKFDLQENPMNLAISSSLDVYIGFDINTRFKVSERSEFQTALELTHYSNGKWRSPNLGLNSVSLSASWLYSLRKPVKPINGHEIINRNRNFAEIIVNSGIKRDDLLNDDLYFVYTGILDFYHSFSPKYAFGAGADFFYDPSLGPTKEAEEKIKQQPGDNYQFGAHAGFLARYGRMHFLLNAGYYLHADYYKYSRVYSRLGMRYALTDHLLLNLNIKAHYAIADFIEWGIGYRFNFSKR